MSFAGSTVTSKLLGSGYFGDPVYLLQITQSRFAFGPMAALACIFAATIFGMEIVIIKILSSREDVFQILLLNNLIAVVIAGLPLFWVLTMPTTAQCMGLMAVGVVMVTGQTVFLYAMQAGDPSLSDPFIYATLVLVVLLDLIVLGVVPDAVSLAGAGIILPCGVYIGFREYRQLLHMARDDLA